jgi:small subunit ribosomal protein S6
MTTAETRNYRATVILDMRGREDSAEELTETVKGEIAALNGEVAEVQHLGSINFARTPDQRFTAGNYVQIDFSAPPLKPGALQERVRLNKAVDRVLVERRSA